MHNKPFAIYPLIFLLFSTAFAQEKTVETLIIEAKAPKTAPPLFFSAAVTAKIEVAPKTIISATEFTVSILQGKPEVIALGLSGQGFVRTVEGAALLDWAVRNGPDGQPHLLELRLKEPEPGTEPAKEFAFTLQARQENIGLPGQYQPLLLTPGKAVGYRSTISLHPDSAVDASVVSAHGLALAHTEAGTRVAHFHAAGDHVLTLAVSQRASAKPEVELTRMKLSGQLDPAARHAHFTLSAEAQVTPEKGGEIDILQGAAALSTRPESGDFHLRLESRPGGEPVYRLRFPKAGTFPVAIAFDAAIKEENGRLSLDFTVPAAAAVPVSLAGAQDLSFDPSAAVFPTPAEGQWIGFLPANGRCLIAWKAARASEEGKLFFATQALEEIRVSAGLLRQATALQFQILQGKLNAATVALEGPGEILAVEGPNLLGWNLRDLGQGKRALELQFSQPLTGQGRVVVRAQTALGAFPARVAALKLTPEGAFRHSGHLRLANEGAVRVEVAGAQGVTQLAPNQFPSTQAVAEGTRQVFVYRYPSAERGYEIVATQILPEITVAQTVVYELGETDRVIQAGIELDIREAPVREYELQLPADHAVVSVTGAEVADYIVGAQPANGQRSLQVLFAKAVAGRQLINLRLEQNLAAQAGPWTLPPLGFPGAKAVRGNIGVVATAGYRVVPGTIQNLVELPLSSFPQQAVGLQQAYRLREGAWSAAMTVESLSQNVQADVFHLYSLKEGNVYGSVLVNYFVVGAPSTEWRLEVPADLGNVAVEGENVQGWRREGTQVIASLHQPALAAATLLLTFEKPMSARGGTLALGDVRPLNVQNERGFVQVVSASQVRLEAAQMSPGLLRMEALELPTEFRLLASSPSLAVYQYSNRPFDLQANITWFEPGQTVDQVVDYANLTSRVSRDGQVATEAKLYVKSRGQKTLRLQLPTGSKLWEAKVAGMTVNARQDGDMTLIPMSATADPNSFVEVVVNLGSTARATREVKLAAPAMEAATMVANWTVSSDEGRLLVPADPRAAELLRPTLTETGFEWLQRRFAWPLLFCLGILLAVALLAGVRRVAGSVPLVSATVWLAIGLVALMGISQALSHRRPNLRASTFVAPVPEPGGSLEINVRNLRAWEAMISPWGVALVAVGLVLLITRRFMRGRSGGIGEWLGWLLVALGLLAQHGGAALFFAWVAAFSVLCMARGYWQIWRNRPKKSLLRAEPISVAASGWLLLAALLWIGSATPTRAEELAKEEAAPAALPEQQWPAADSLEQTWKLEKGRLHGQIKIRLTGKAGESFLLLRGPGVITRAEGAGLRLAKQTVGEQTAYLLVIDADGSFSGEAAFELPVGEGATSFPIPTGLAAVERIDFEMDQVGWEVNSPRAVRLEPLANLAEGRGGARLLLGPRGESTISLRPRSRDVASEATQFFSETANLFLPAPGAIDGRHLVSIRPSRGQVRDLVFEVPAGFTVSEVANGPVGQWRFDPESRALRVAIEPAQTTPFLLLIETQRGLASLPSEATLAPLRVRQAASDVGMLGLAFAADAQPEKIAPDKLTKVNLEDFVASLLKPRGKDDPAPVLHQVYRYGAEPGTLALTVAPVSPEVRAETSQTLSLGDDRVVLAVDVMVNIMRAGLFRLSFALPDGLEMEAASGPALSHWTESTENNARLITLHLNGRTLGEQKFALGFNGPQPSAQSDWTVPKFLLREATRQTGQLTLTPGQGIRLQSTGRRNVSQIDAREMSSRQPGTLAFRLLQADWELKLGIDALQPWLTAQVLQESSLREGQTRTRLALRYRVENAAVKSVRLELPVTADEEQTLRATGAVVSDLVKVPNENNLWEVRFQRSVLGEVSVDIEYRRATQREGGTESIPFARLRDIRQSAYWLAIRGGGRLEIRIEDLGRGWQQADWNSVPSELRKSGDLAVPAMIFRAVEPEAPLQVRVERHAVAEALKLRVKSGNLATVFSPHGQAYTRVNLEVEVLERAALRVALPEKATLFNALVNGESVGLVRDGEAFQFHVFPKEIGGMSDVSFAYQVAGNNGQETLLQGPRLNVPLQNVQWHVALPEGYQLRKASGDLERVITRGANVLGEIGLDYASKESSKKEGGVRNAQGLIGQANLLLQKGEQEKAWQTLQRASRASADAASNEDARVQLRELRNSQAVMALNARRQSLYLENSKETPSLAQKEQLIQSATANPLLNGELNYNQEAVSKALEGNTAEETQALKRIAARLVSQQQAADPALQAIDPTLPTARETLTFKRAVQVNGDAPLRLRIKIARTPAVPLWGMVGMIGVLALVLALGVLQVRRAG